MTKIYNHAFTFAFTIETPIRDGSKLSPTALREAILDTLNAIPDAQLLENVGEPFDSFSYEQDGNDETH